MANNILVCESGDLEFQSFDYELLTKGRELADRLDGKVFFQTSNLNKDRLESLKIYGVDIILNYDSDEILSVNDLSKVIEDMVDYAKASIVLFPATEGKVSLASMLSTRWNSGLTAECINLEIWEEHLIFERAALNQSVTAKIMSLDSSVLMCTVKKGAFPLKTDVRHSKVHIVNFTPPKSTMPEVKFLGRRDREDREVDLSRYNTVFCVGRGVKNKDILHRIERVAHSLDSIVCGTRPIVEEGWIKKECQIGQSGNIISPNLYVALGVSGASQHMAGIQNADTIVAINSDPEAHIFDYSSCQIVDDVEDVIQKLEKILEMRMK